MDSIIAILIQKDSMAIFSLRRLLCKFDQDWSSNNRDYEGKNYTFLTKWQKSEFSVLADRCMLIIKLK